MSYTYTEITHSVAGPSYDVFMYAGKTAFMSVCMYFTYACDEISTYFTLKIWTLPLITSLLSMFLNSNFEFRA